ncbi:PDZ domain-containing protein [Thermodesulfobacterium thermophilum]|uniref:PDZ domain-containing protein n=1 Tax=Thermodesulfobacterium thermophilum TaxID=886 RepID=UPI0003B6FB02|nr:PDZ domain-containing protein [Thermodesulfobacterium thermophilum]
MRKSAKLFLILVIFLSLLNFAYAQEKYTCIETRTDLVNGEIQYAIKKDNTVEFVLNNCVPENLKLKVNNRTITYQETRRLVENGNIEKNDLFVIECRNPDTEGTDVLNYQTFVIRFYRAKISPLLTPDYPLYPTIKQVAKKLGLEMPHRTFVVFDGFGGASHEFFCYAETPPASDGCRYSFDEVLEIHAKQKNVADLDNLGKKYFSRLDLDKAEKAFKKAIEVSENPDYSDLLLFYMATGQYEKAKNILFHQIKNSPYNPSHYLSLAKIYLYEKKYDKAKAFAETALIFDPDVFGIDLYEAYYILGKIAEFKNDYRKAIFYFKKVLEHVRERCEYFSLRFWGEDKATMCDVSALPYQIEILHSLNMLERFNEAKALIDTIAPLTEANPLEKIHIAFTYAGKGEYKKAFEILDDIISGFTNNGIGAEVIQGEIYPEIIRVYRNSPAEKAGLKPRDKIINIDNRDLRLYRQEGNMLDKVTKYIQGNEIVKITIQSGNSSELRDLEIKPEVLTSPEASEALGFKAIILRITGNSQEFENYAVKSYELNPENPLACMAMSLLYCDKGRHKEAIEILKKLESNYQDNLFSLVRIVVYSKAGQIELAKKFYNRLPEQLLKTRNAVYRQLLNEVRFKKTAL